MANISLTLVQQPIQSLPPLATFPYDDVVRGASTGLPGTNNTLFLWETGCRINETWNCDAAYSNTDEGYNTVWKSTDALPTLRNCLVYPIVATAASEGWLIEDPPGLLDHFGITPSNIIPDSEAETVPWNVVNSCLSTICNALYGGNSSEKCLDTGGGPTRYHIGPADEPWIPELVDRCLNFLRSRSPADICDAGSLD